MGNWRTAHIRGTCGPEDVLRLRAYLKQMSDRNLFSGIGLCGFPNWGNSKFDMTANLCEKDPSDKEIRDSLSDLLFAARSLIMDVWIGGDYESKEVVRQYHVEDGVIREIEPPTETLIPEIPDDQFTAQFFRQMGLQ